jgi:hypothetical protein
MAALNSTHHRVHSKLSPEDRRLCLRPERKPGVAPPCEDDAIKSPGDYMKFGKPVTLPRLTFLEGRDDRLL